MYVCVCAISRKSTETVKKNNCNRYINRKIKKQICWNVQFIWTWFSVTKLNQIVRLNWHEMNMLESRCQQQCLCLCVLVCVPNKLLNTVWIDSVDTIAAVAQSIQIWLHRFAVFPLVIDEMCSICCARVLHL